MGAALEAVAAACLTEASFSKPIPRSWTAYAPLPRGTTGHSPSSTVQIFGRTASLRWSKDHGLLIAAIALACAGVIVFLLAARAR